MSYIIHDNKDINKILSTIGISSIDSLFESIPDEFKIKNLNLDSAMSEASLKTYISSLSNKNISYEDANNFMGAGSYYHYIPSAINHLASRAEFYTAYTPYQPEVSQGTLQAIFEFQTYITRLTGLDLANASMYDASTALAEAILMVYRSKKQKLKKVILPKNLHPEAINVLKSWLEPYSLDLVFIDAVYEIDSKDLELNLKDVLCLVIQSPNFYGYTETRAKELTNLVKASGGASIFLCFEATSLALYKSPAELGFDIAVLELQSLGNPVSYGGPHAGVIACTNDFVRELPGRIVGETCDADNNKVFVLTLATREQHIRREKATSNICSNQALVALRSCMYLALLGASGLKKVALISYSKSKELAKKLNAIDGISVNLKADFYNEFLVNFDDKNFLDTVISNLKAKGINPGYRINDTSMLVASTECISDESIQSYVNTILELI